MATVSICRTCLGSNIKMYHIANTPYQEIFERLATKLQTDDSRPQTVCYVCVSQLRRCRRFVDMSRQAEEILTYFHQNSIQLSEKAVNILDRKFVRKVTRTPLQFMSLNDPLEHTTRAIEMQIKEEPTDLDEQPIGMKADLSGVTQPTMLTHQPITIKKQPNWLRGELHAMEELPSGLEDQFNIKVEYTENENQLTESALTEVTQNKLTGVEQNDELIVKQEIKEEMDCDNDNSELATELEIEVPDVSGRSGKSDRDTGRGGAGGAGGSGKGHQCELCDKSYTHKFRLNRHMKIHRGGGEGGEGAKAKDFTCEKCGKGFLERSTLTKHLALHAGARRFHCDLCGHSARQKDDLARHMLTHTGVKPYPCDVCGRRFGRRSNMSLHRRTHAAAALRPYPCAACGAAFARRHDRARHAARRHANAKPHACALCDFRSANAGYLDTHVRKKHNFR